VKYIVCEKPRKFLLKEKEAPVRKENEALLQINKVGICGTDLHAYAGNQAYFEYPKILGHELATEVIDIGVNDRGINKGDKVVVMPYISCGVCFACNKGKTNCCENITVLGVHVDGGLQEQISVPLDILLPANHLSDDQMAIVEPLAIGAHAIRRSGIETDETVAVVGCGPIGIGIMKLAQIAGAKVIALDINVQRLNYARDKLGVDHVVNVEGNALREVIEITNGDLCSIVFDASGNKNALETCPDYMSNGGKLVLVGLSKGELRYSHPKVHAKEMTLLCSRNAIQEDFQHVMTILDQFPISSFITHNVPFIKMIEHFDSWLDPTTGVIKATVNFEK